MAKSLDGILLLDKPTGMTSNLALQKVKRALNARKAGHTGSLDPLASGMLPLCFGEATKFSRFFLEADKCYQTTMRLGITTTTADSEGEILIERPVPELNTALLQNMLVQFQGPQAQIPPMYSAIKHKGQPLYKMARKGKSIPREARPISIQSLILEGFSQEATETTVSLTVVCSKGTYIRTLIEDMGAYLGCGAHVTVLRRRWAFPFQDYPMHSIQGLYEIDTQKRASQSLLSISNVLGLFLPTVHIDPSGLPYILKGQPIKVAQQLPLGWVTLLTPAGDLVGVGEMQTEGVVAPRRLLKQDDAMVEPIGELLQ